MRRRFAVALTLTAALVAPARAYDFLGDSYPERELPRICCFERLRDGFVATLCGLYTGQWDADGESDRPRVEFRASKGWRWLQPVAPSAATCGAALPGAAPSAAGAGWPHAPGCPARLVAAMPDVSAEEVARLRPDVQDEGGGKQDVGKQDVGSCIEQGGNVWFGLAFYDGEGATGVGGVGRFDPRSGKIEVRRPRLLRGWSSTALFHDGTWLWLGTYAFAEGGPEPAIGLVRYDWAHDRVVPEPDAMCGFLAVGMVKLGDALWLASDGGLSRRRTDRRWEHLAFRVGQIPAVERTTCARELERARTTGDREWFDEVAPAYIDARKRARAADAK